MHFLIEHVDFQMIFLIVENTDSRGIIVSLKIICIIWLSSLQLYNKVLFLKLVDEYKGVFIFAFILFAERFHNVFFLIEVR